MVLKKTEIDNSELKYKSINANKIAYNKNVQPKKFHSQKQNINNQANYANCEVNNSKLKCYRRRNVSHLANVCKYINTLCNLRKIRGHSSKVFKIKNKSSEKQMNALNSVDVYL